MKVKPMEEVVAALTPIAEGLGLELVEGKWDSKNRSLTLFIDCAEGVDLNKCEAFHRAVDLPLDELDPTFGEPYTLNCSSLGRDRPFKTQRDYARRLGEKIEVRLYAPVDGKKLYEGVLKSFDETSFTIVCEEGEKSFLMEKTAKVCLSIEV